MKRINILIVIIGLCITSCGDFLDTDNLVKKDSDNFPKSPEDALQALYGAYSPIFGMPADQNPFLVGELLSDDRFGGGGQNDLNPQAINVFKATSENQFKEAWKSFYEGVFRTNALISSIDQITWDNEPQKNKIVGETYFLRAFYYFNMARMWGTVPLVITPLPQNNPKASPEELFGQILYDLKIAIESLPATEQPKSELGRTTKWAAEALIARAYLFYDGYYKSNARADVQLADESILTAAQIITWLDDCIKNSGYKLAKDFRNQWPYSITDIPEAEYKYAKDNNLNWLRETGDNEETMFATKFSILGGWDQNDEIPNNQLVTYQGWRDQTIIPFGQGWGFGPVNPKLYNEWPDTDLRKQGSICYVDDPNEGISDFKWGGDMMWQETGYWQKKYMPVNVKRNDNQGNEEICNYGCVLYGRAPNFQTNNTQDLVYIRFADVLLMHSELTKTTDGINEVRDRANLTPLDTYTEEALRQERRYELAFEGIRYYDLLRWYGKEAGTVMKANMTGARIWNMGAETTINQDKNNGYFDAIDVRLRETGGFLQIPNEEISLSGGILVQNPGWEGTSVMFN